MRQVRYGWTDTLPDQTARPTGSSWILTIVSDAESYVSDLKTKSGKDIWLFGGGELFHSLLAAGLVDGVDVGVIPVLLGGGVPLLPTPAPRAALKLVNHRIYEKSGIALLEYDVIQAR